MPPVQVRAALAMCSDPLNGAFLDNTDTGLY